MSEDAKCNYASVQIPFYCSPRPVTDEDSQKLQELQQCVPVMVSAGDGAPCARVFKPEDQHCGIWKASEIDNEHQRCSASFGDAGTTASVSCFGNLIQMNQYLGTGQSGMFAMDDSTAPEPYYVCERAEQLDSMAKVPDGYEYTHFGLRLQDELYPKHFPWVAPKVKWVNWRWPRYEWKTARTSKLKVISQWLVHNNVLLHQLVLENEGQEPIKSIAIQPGLTDDIQVRDQNHLELGSACGCDTCTHETTFPAPLNYGRVTIHALRNPGRLEPREQPRDNEDTWSVKNAQSVAAVVALFVNGSGVQLAVDNLPLTYDIDGATTDRPGTLEFTMAYKLIVIPEHNTMGWKEFLFDAQRIDVNKLLWLETEKLWGHSHQTSTSLLDLGLSKVCLGHTSNAREPTCKEATSSGPSNDKANSARESPTESTGPDELAEYLVWRHLEFILSVCAIPIKPPRLWTKAEGTSAAGDPPIALTCGDMSGHRVCTSASFFAFQFLLDVLEWLKHQTLCPYLLDLQKRIELVCLGHIRWLHWLRKPNCFPGWYSTLLSSGLFAANYWVNGSRMPKDPGCLSWQPENMITDTLFQVLKMTGYAKYRCPDRFRRSDDEKEEHDDGLVDELLLDVWIPLLYNLDKTDVRRKYAWPHRQRDGVNIFRLDDHVWLWKCLSEMKNYKGYNWAWGSQADQRTLVPTRREILWMRQLVKEPNSDSPNYDPVPEPSSNKEVQASRKVTQRQVSSRKDIFKEVTQRLLPRKVKHGILQRFSTLNEVSNTPMLAVARSLRGSRFLLHSRDTALFYGDKWGFFSGPGQFEELWKHTILSQVYHDEYQENHWEKTLRFGLSAVAKTRDHLFDSLADPVKHLVQACDHNGFISGYLDASSQSPCLFSAEIDRDYFYHVGFEVNHILLTLALARHDENESGNTRLPLSLSPGLEEPKFNMASAGRSIEPAKTVMKKLLPLNSGINVVNIDNEWLYNYPEFFNGISSDFDPKESAQPVWETGKIDRKKPIQGSWISELTDDENIREALPRRFQEPESTVEGTAPDELWLRLDEWDRENVLEEWSTRVGDHKTAFVANTPKRKYLSKEQKRSEHLKDPDFLSNIELWNHIGSARSPINAKKRFIWLPCANRQTAGLCCAASTGSEKTAMSRFFDHHSMYQNHVWDDTSMVQNTWSTELHFSFYVLVYKDDHITGLPEMARGIFPGSSGKEIRRAAMGFRFNGDLFDRHWTCHFIQNVLSGALNSGPHKWDFKLRSDGAGTYQDKRWWQRKVLELDLVHRMLDTMIDGSKAILSGVDDELGIKEEILSLAILKDMNRETYNSYQDDWQRFEHILQAVEEDLARSLGTLDNWMKREQDRGQGKPRWTQNDERKYRGDIERLQARTERQVWEIHVQQQRIKQVKVTLTINREKVRDDLQTSREGSIRHLTYVTVIFLPLGFATGLLSMSGPPQYEWIAPLVRYSAVAFAATIVLLLCVRPLFAAVRFAANPLSRAMKHVGEFSSVTRQNSWLNKAQAANKPPETKPWFVVGQESGCFRDADYYSATHWFWPAYIFLEIPARNVFHAVSVLRSSSPPAWRALNLLMGTICFLIYGVSRLIQMGAIGLTVVLKVFGWAILWCGYNLTAHSDFPSGPSGDKAGAESFEAQKTQGPSGETPRGLEAQKSPELSGETAEGREANEANGKDGSSWKKIDTWLLPPEGLRQFEEKVRRDVLNLAGGATAKKTVS